MAISNQRRGEVGGRRGKRSSRDAAVSLSTGWPESKLWLFMEKRERVEEKEKMERIWAVSAKAPMSLSFPRAAALSPFSALRTIVFNHFYDSLTRNGAPAGDTAPP